MSDLLHAQRLFTTEQRAALLENSRRTAQGEDIDPPPVVKLFLPGTECTWLLTELNPADEDVAFGLCDLGHQCPELGYVSLEEITSAKSGLGLTVERDMHFTANKTLSGYAEAAYKAGCIIA